jgi:trehalose/maltose hydrolase-like predicted phosphorylase
MKRSAALLCALLLAGASGVPALAHEGFKLSVGLNGLPSYFPGVLGNGYLATRTAPRGTDATQTYMVGLMDRTPGDIARPACLPGWNAIDFNPAPAGDPRGWLDRAALGPEHFTGYRQTLDLHDATLTTRYRYVEGARTTAIRVVSFVSQRQPHLAVSRLTFTPQYSGEVRLSFPLSIWKEHAPRFALARLSGPQVQRALAAHGLALTPRPPATADRAALWYPGYVAVARTGASARERALWLEGRAANSLAVAMAAVIALPKSAPSRVLVVRHGVGHLALEVSLRVERGRTYSVTKYVVMSRSGWGGSVASSDLRAARAARAQGFARLLARQRQAWRGLWRPDIVIAGDARAQQVAHAALYYLLVSTTPDTGWAVGPCGLTTCYAGHVFWDSDTWVYPALLLLHPRRARSLLTFRERTLAQAEARARANGYAGAMYPWESDPYNGTDQTPYSAHVLSLSEIHVNSEIAIAQWQYYLATLDRRWLRVHGWPVIRAVARFWTSRVTWNARRHRYDILHVTSVAESEANIPDDTYTNLGAAAALRIADHAARVLGVRPDPRWRRIARELYIPIAPGGRHYLPFGTAKPGGKSFGAGPLPLLFLPALDVRMPAALRRGTYDYAVRAAAPARIGRFSMGIMPWVSGAVEAGEGGAAAGRWLQLFITGGTLKPPYDVQTETAANEVGPFLTGSSGYLQSLIYGLTGLRIRAAGLVAAYPPVLPPGWRSLRLKNVAFRGRRFDVVLARTAAGGVRLRESPTPAARPH